MCGCSWASSHTKPECWLAWSHGGLVQATAAALSSWGQHSITSRGHSFTSALPTSGSWNLLAPSSTVAPESWGIGEGLYRCLICGGALPSHWFSAFWPAVNFYINHHPVHKEAFLMRLEQHWPTSGYVKLERCLVLCPLLETVSFPAMGSWPDLQC